MPKQPTEELRGKPDRTSLVGSRVFPVENIDLTKLGSRSRVVLVQGLNEASVRCDGSPWTTAIVEVLRSIDGINGDSFPSPIELTSSDREIYRVDIRGVPFLIFETTRSEVGADLAAPLNVYCSTPEEGTSSDFFLEVAKGSVAGHSVLRKQGRKSGLVVAATEDIWGRPGIFVPPTTARIHDIISGSVLDTAAGTGARTLLLRGLDASGLRINEIVTLNGLINVPTVNAYTFITALDVLTAGSTGKNQGTITAIAQVDLTISSHMDPNLNQDNMAITKIPSDARGFIYLVAATTLRAAGGQAGSAEFFITAEVPPLAEHLLGVTELETAALPRIDVPLQIPQIVPSNTIVRTSAITGATMMDIQASITLMLIDN